MNILYNYTTRSRPELFKRGLASIIDNSESPNYRVLVSIDEDDETMNNEAMWVNIENTPRVQMVVGKRSTKILAINRDVNEFEYDWDIIVNMSDDMVFTKKGFDNVIRYSFDSLNRCLHFPDGNRNDLITMAILGRKYYDNFLYIYHSDYVSLWCDNEMTEVSKKLGAYKYVDEQIFTHLHPAYDAKWWDNQYRFTESFNQVDRETFERRQKNNFDLRP